MQACGQNRKHEQLHNQNASSISPAKPRPEEMNPKPTLKPSTPNETGDADADSPRHCGSRVMSRPASEIRSRSWGQRHWLSTTYLRYTHTIHVGVYMIYTYIENTDVYVYAYIYICTYTCNYVALGTFGLYVSCHHALPRANVTAIMPALLLSITSAPFCLMKLRVT